MIVGLRSGEEIKTKHLIACGGLHADKIGAIAGLGQEPELLPFRGEWLQLKPEASATLVKGNIYPVPDPSLPFLGVHFTPRPRWRDDGTRISRDIWMGPNAVLAFGREAYGPLQGDLSTLSQILMSSAAGKLFLKYWRQGLREIKNSVFASLQVEEARRFIPDLRMEDVDFGVYQSGVRAQAVGQDGSLIEDFVLQTSPLGLQLHVRNAPSPAATSCLAIADEIVSRASRSLSNFPWGSDNPL